MLSSLRKRRHLFAEDRHVQLPAWLVILSFPQPSPEAGYALVQYAVVPWQPRGNRKDRPGCAQCATMIPLPTAGFGGKFCQSTKLDKFGACTGNSVLLLP